MTVLRRHALAGLSSSLPTGCLWVWLYRIWPKVLDAMVLVKPATVIDWHRTTVDWATSKPSLSSSPWMRGAPHSAKYMVRRRRPPSQGWKTFLRNHAPHIGAVDLFVVPTAGFKLLYGLIIITLQRRHLVWINVTANPTADWIARQITEAFPWEHAPRYLIRDRDASYGHAVTRRLTAMGIRDRPTAPRSPWQNGHAERLIGSIRRECLDHVVILGEAYLRRLLATYASYYNELRTHRSLTKDAPLHRSVERLGTISSQPILGGLHHQYCRI